VQHPATGTDFTENTHPDICAAPAPHLLKGCQVAKRRRDAADKRVVVQEEVPETGTAHGPNPGTSTVPRAVAAPTNWQHISLTIRRGMQPLNSIATRKQFATRHPTASRRRHPGEVARQTQRGAANLKRESQRQSK
jgi:hypothetical protein